MRKLRGFTLIEFLVGTTLALIIGLILSTVLTQVAYRFGERQSAKQARSVAFQMARYTIARHDSLLSSATWPITVTQAQLLAAGYPVPMGTNSFGQAYELWIAKDPTGELQPMMVTTGGTAIPSGRLRHIARDITDMGGTGGFVDNATAPIEPGAAFAFGSSGLNLNMAATYGKTPGVGHVVDAIYLGEAVQAPGLTNTALQRVAIPGQSDLNTMHTDINGGGNSARNFNTVNATYVGSGGKDGASGYPTGWTGGTHGTDAYFEGTFATGTNGVVNASINNAGGGVFANLTSNSEVYVNNWFRVNGSGGLYWQQYGCGWQVVDSAWLRSYNNCGIYTAGQVQAGSVAANGRLTAQEYIQLNGLGNLGWSCSPDGLIGRASDGSGAIQCKGGVWISMQGMVDAQQVVSAGSTCGPNWNPVWATCPAGTRVTGGGYWMNAYRPTSGATSNAPDISAPNGNGWVVSAGSSNGNTCFAAYAVCGR